MTPSLQPNQSFISLEAAQSQAAVAALGGYGKIMQVSGHPAQIGSSGVLPLLASYRYAPYQLPSAALASNPVAQASMMMAQHRYHASQTHQEQSGSAQQQLRQPPQPLHQATQSGQMATSLNLGSTSGIATIAQTGHAPTVIPTVSISGGGSLTSPAVASPANVAKYSGAVNTQGTNPFQVRLKSYT